MKILFVSDTYFPHVNGVYYFVRRLAVLLQEKGHDVSVLVPSENMYCSEKMIDGLKVYGVPSVPILVYPKIRFAIPVNLKYHVKNIVRQLRPNIIHIQDHFDLAKAVVEVNRGFDIPVLGTNHFMPENVTALLPFPFLNKRLEKWMWAGFTSVFNQLKLVTTPTEMAASLIRPKLSTDVIPVSNGIDLERFKIFGETAVARKKYAIPEKPVLLYVGRLDPEKRLDDVMHAVAKASKNIDFCFVIVGKGTAQGRLERLSNKLGIRKKVVFAGFVPDEDLPLFHKMAQCFIMASIAELQSISTMEAMASGLPVIAADAGALGELVRHGKNGYLFDNGDIGEMSGYIEKLLADPYLAKEMGRNGLKIIFRHDIKLTLDAFETIYKELRKMDMVSLRVVSKNN